MTQNTPFGVSVRTMSLEKCRPYHLKGRKGSIGKTSRLIELNAMRCISSMQKSI
jgi:hypothetical protein